MEFFTERKQLSSKVEIFLYKFYNKITFCPIVISHGALGIKVKINQMMRVLAIFALIYACMHMSSLLVYPFFTSETEALLNTWSIEMNIIMIFSTTLTILIETQMTHTYLTDFLLLKQKIEHDLRILCDPKQFENEQYKSMKIYTRILFCFSIFTVIVFILNIYRYSMMMVIFTCCLGMARIFGQLRSFQHQLFTGTLHVYIKLVRIKCEECIRNINQNEAMARVQNSRHFTMNSNKIFNELILSIRIFANIYRMTHLVNKIFGFSLLVLLLQDFIQLLTFIFWVYLKLYLHQLNDITGLRNSTDIYWPMVNVIVLFTFGFYFRHFTSKFVHILHHHSTSCFL